MNVIKATELDTLKCNGEFYNNVNFTLRLENGGKSTVFVTDGGNCRKPEDVGGLWSDGGPNGSDKRAPVW